MSHPNASRALRLSMIVVGVLAAGCEKKNDRSTTTTNAASQPTTAPTTAKTEATGAASVAAPVGAEKPSVTWKGFATPESVLVDPSGDHYLVSNVDGAALAADKKGFISKISPDGNVTDLKWIESGKNKVTLNAPKGMAIANDLLWVADLDTVRTFDPKTGEPKGDVKVPGATFLNDVVAGPDDRVYVSDTGMKAGGKGFEPSGTDAVYAIGKDKKLVTIAKDKSLGGPNGLAIGGDKSWSIWVASFATGELYTLDEKGKRQNAEKLPKGSLDGLVVLPGGDVLVSSWEASAVFRGKGGGPWREVIRDVKSPADISYDAKRGRVLVPLFDGNEVRAYDLR